MTDRQIHSLFAATGKGMEQILAREVEALGGTDVVTRIAGVGFAGTLEVAYRVLLWSRTASRVHLNLSVFEARNEDQLYEGAKDIAWTDHVPTSGRLAVDATATRSPITHTGFAALKVKDAIVDHIRNRHGTRPSVDTHRPDVRINVHLEENEAVVALDLAGEGMHHRGYRTQTGEAPLRENLAATMLMLAGWPEQASATAGFVDPMCGSGTLVIEAALAAADVAPGLARTYHGIDGWLGHERGTWETMLDEARERAKKGLRSDLPLMWGNDSSRSAIKMATANARRAGVDGVVRWRVAPLGECAPPPDANSGILMTNPPYGIRIEGRERGGVGEHSTESLEVLYQQIGDVLRRRFGGWTGYVLAGNPELVKRIGLRASARHIVFNGSIECRLLEYGISDKPVETDEGPAWRQARRERASSFANRLAKNLKRVGRWARRNEITCFRVYDSDIPEYAVAVDRYADAALVQEYRAPSTIDPHKAKERLEDVVAVVPEVLGIDPSDVHLRVRRRQRDGDQYEKQSEQGVTRIVEEQGLRFSVNLTDYLDTGLILDLRNVRSMIREQASELRFLNLFAYTGTATVCAAAGGAHSTTTVDMSTTYLDWAQRNMALNEFRGPDHTFLREDCLVYMERERRSYDLILLAPPTFSRSKRMQTTLDLQHDHVQLIEAAAGLLSPGGTLLFVASARRFKMDTEALEKLSPRNINSRTVPDDFKRTPRVHSAWTMSPPRSGS